MAQLITVRVYRYIRHHIISVMHRIVMPHDDSPVPVRPGTKSTSEYLVPAGRHCNLLIHLLVPGTRGTRMLLSYDDHALLTGVYY